VPVKFLIIIFSMGLKHKYTVKPISKNLVHEWFKKKHYAKRSPSTMSYTFGLFDEYNILIGVCAYGMPANGRCLLLCGETYKFKVIELQRVIKNDGLEKNVQSYFISQTFKYLPNPTIVISYADPNNGHVGYTYQSLNFLYTGLAGFNKEYIEPNGKNRTDRYVKKHLIKTGYYNKEKTINEMWSDLGGRVIYKEKKHRYIYMIADKRTKKDMMSKLIWNVSEYPKGENVRYNTDYMPSIQTQLF
jgi:hypothetical protein